MDYQLGDDNGALIIISSLSPYIRQFYNSKCQIDNENLTYILPHADKLIQFILSTCKFSENNTENLSKQFKFLLKQRGYAKRKCNFNEL